MTWYRHWLELRWRLPLFALVALLLGAWRPGRGMNGAADFSHTGRMYKALQETVLAQSIGTEDLFIWAAFTERIWILAWLSAFLFVGNGLRTALLPRDLSIYYMLGLPVSRGRLIWTRHAANLIAGILLLAMTWGVHCVVLWFQGRAVPFVPMAQSAAFTILILVAWIAVMAALSAVMYEIWAFLATLPLFIITQRPAWDLVTAFLARGEFPWTPAAALLAIAALSFAFMLHAESAREF